MLVTCPACGARNQEVGKFCEQCGTKVTDTVGAVADTSNGGVQNDLKIPTLVAADADDSAADSLDDVLAPPTLTNTDASDDEPLIQLEPPNEANEASDSVPALTPPDAAEANDTPELPPTMPSAVPSDGTGTGRIRFIRLENGVQNPTQSFVVPVGSRMLVGRTDPANGVFPDVDITMWSQRVATPDGPLYTVHRKQCFVSRDSAGVLWIVDYKEYIGDTMVSPTGAGQFRTIPALAGERETNAEGGIRLEVGDRILMGQAEGMLIFVIIQE